MFWLITKREAEKEFSKVSQSFKDIKKDFKDLNKDIVSNKEKIARLEGVVSMIIKEKSQKVSTNPKKSQDKIETKLINRVRRSKKALIMSEIAKLRDSHSVIEMFELIVLEKGLCSKASFYRYVASLKSQSQVPETKIRQLK